MGAREIQFVLNETQISKGNCVQEFVPSTAKKIGLQYQEELMKMDVSYIPFASVSLNYYETIFFVSQ